MDELLTAEEAERKLKMAPGFIYHNWRRLRMPFVKIGKCLRIRPEDLDRWVQNRRVYLETEEEKERRLARIAEDVAKRAGIGKADRGKVIPIGRPRVKEEITEHKREPIPGWNRKYFGSGG